MVLAISASGRDIGFMSCLASSSVTAGNFGAGCCTAGGDGPEFLESQVPPVKRLTTAIRNCMILAMLLLMILAFGWTSMMVLKINSSEKLPGKAL
jgi:hypothetical protein